jgi:hypothetical protein
MKRALLLSIAVALAYLPGCAAPGAEGAPSAIRLESPAETPQLWNFSDAAPLLRQASCPETLSPQQGFAELDLSIEPLTSKQVEVIAGRLPASATLAGAWELKATDPNFGGLSGLAFENDESLLAISDAGGWVRIALDAGTPTTASIGYMRNAAGAFLSGKSENDAEGLAYRDGVALVSFERDFRIEAFALGACGASSRAVEIASLPTMFDGHAVDENEGPEALTLTPNDALRFAYEGASDSLSPIGHVFAAGTADWSGARASNPAGFALVSMDTISLPDGSQRDVFLYRAFDPLRGARSVLTWGPGEADRLTLSRPLLTDNFEGLAVQVLESGQLRLWIVSDNNFTKLQRTLLYAFDVTP